MSDDAQQVLLTLLRGSIVAFILYLYHHLLWNVPMWLSYQVFKYSDETEYFRQYILGATVIICTYLIISKINRIGKNEDRK